MQATIYQNADGKYVLAFRGTEPNRQAALDIANDVAGGVATSPQVLDAINVSTKLAKAVGRETLTLPVTRWVASWPQLAHWLPVGKR